MKEKQDNKAFPSDIQKYGCYFFCLLRMVELESGNEFSADGINILYYDCVAKGYIKAKCSCVKPDDICRLALDMIECKKKIYQVGAIDASGKPTFWGWARKKPYNDPKYIALTFQTRGEIGTHYVLANSMQEILFDPSSTDYTSRPKLGGLLHSVVSG
jgi:hypothetical protein